jgi:hypothetical protein
VARTAHVCDAVEPHDVETQWSTQGTSIRAFITTDQGICVHELGLFSPINQSVRMPYSVMPHALILKVPLSQATPNAPPLL